MNVGETAAGVMKAARTFTMDDVPKIYELVDHLPKADQLSLARNMLRAPEVHSSPIARGPLVLIQQLIEPIRSPSEQGAALINGVKSKVATEIDRIDGVIPSGGYDGHQDYAAIGQVIEGLDLLDTLGAFARL